MIAETLIAQPGIGFESELLVNALLLFMIGLVSFSRVFLKAHNVLQVVTGIVVGFVVVFGMVFLQLNI